MQSVNDGLSVNLRKPLKNSGNWPWRFQIKTNMDLKTRNWFVHPNAQCFSGRSCISQISIIVRFFCTLYAMIFFSFFFLPNFNICKSFQTRENLNWEMVFCYQNCSDLLREKIVLVIKKKLWGWRPRIWKFVEITRTIYSNSERSEQFMVIECFFNLFLEVSRT